MLLVLETCPATFAVPSGFHDPGSQRCWVAGLHPQRESERQDWPDIRKAGECSPKSVFLGGGYRQEAPSLWMRGGVRT